MDSVALAMQQDDSDGILGQVLLERQVPINRHKHIELGLSEIEQFAIRYTGPALSLDGLRVKARNVRSKRASTHSSSRTFKQLP